MLVRLVIAILLAAFAMPVGAGAPRCHGGSAMTVGAATQVAVVRAHRRMTSQPDAVPSHRCAWCVPIADWLGERLSAQIVVAALGPVARIATLDPGTGMAPALPPPRRG